MFAMIGLLPPGGFGLRGVGCAAAAALVLLAVTAPLRPAAADDDPYTVTITVDATADNVPKARDMARLDGQRKALTAVVDKLAGGPGKVKMPKLSDNQITDLVASFEVADEKMTAVRYTADYTYHFQAAAVQTMLTTAGITIGQPNAGTATAAAPAATPPPAPDTGTPPPSGPTANLVAVLPVTSLEDLIKARDRLAGLPTIRKVELQTLSRQEATLNIQYAGTQDQLKSDLATIGFDLQGGDANWRLARSGPGHP
jgi:hypothetical protein